MNRKEAFGNVWLKASAPIRKAEVLIASASIDDGETIVTDATAFSQGYPVLGSIIWWYLRPSLTKYRS